ncbi:MAG: histidine phosphatase family protein [Dokdonella sp.]|uniref:SixA phosphatase family protein n=1 Tax=Dokdonella sp. TaxID=2291710 RepID=UPI0025C5A0FE|nr:histidine phosphatase family protein [Dokdonella sp.]MBZ0224191.1 histidine phosphatase family protein [Dokdonella sp.]MCC7255885.1 histidine phosphatase family protein [Dokdonella sp.]
MSTRDLILVRHAHAQNAASGQGDLERTLSATGIAEADAAGLWLKQHGAAPDRVLCSTAQRAQATCERLVAALGCPRATEDARIYEATPATLLRLIDEHTEARCLLLVGHNPGLESLVALLSEGASDAGRGMPPGAVAWLSLPQGELEPATARVRHFWWP